MRRPEGHIQKRGKNSYRLKFDAGNDPLTGKRKIKYQTFRGTKSEAKKKLSDLISSVNTGTYIEPTKITTVAYVRERIDAWEAAGSITAKTAEGYRLSLDNQIALQIGGILLQRLLPTNIEQWHAHLLTQGLAPRTILHAHRVLSKALKDALKNDLVAKNVAALQQPPKVPDQEMNIVKDVPAIAATLPDWQYGVIGQVALFTGMRRGEVMALRWGRVDLEAKVVQVRESLEFTKKYGLRFKAPKTNSGRRDVTIPDVLLDTLRQYRKEQIEARVRMGLGKLPDDTLLFANVDGSPLSPNAVSASWTHFAAKVGLVGVRFHDLRHTHVSQLVDQGVDIVTISRRIGHSKPDVTLRIYSHLFQKDDAKAAAAINAAMAPQKKA